MTKFYTFQKTEDISVSPENPDEASSTNAQNGWIPKLLGRLMDRMAEQKGVGWNVDTPITALAAKQAIDANQALGYKPDVRATTTTNITLSGAQTIDTVAVVAGNRVLVKNQTTTSQNGIYVVASGAWTRTSDLDDAGDFLNGVTVRVREGSAGNAGQFYYLSSTSAVVVGTTGITFAVQPGAPTAVADASNTQKGASTLTVNPVTSTAPIAIGSNDPIHDTVIWGCALTWDSATSIAMEPGALWFPAANKVVNVTTRVTLTGITTPGINTKQYVYAVYNTGTGAVTLALSTTAPTSYSGRARTLTGNTTHRYVGMVLGNAAGTGLYRWRWHANDFVMYLQNMLATPFLAFSNTSITTTLTTIDPTATLPVTSGLIQAHAIYDSESTGAGSQLVFGNSDAQFTLTAPSGDAPTSGLGIAYMHSDYTGEISSLSWLMPLDASQQFQFKGSLASTALYVSVQGYQEVR